VHLILFKIGQYPPVRPVVVYMDNAEQFFAGGGKKAKADKDGPVRFQKV
jgi:hypothetical protein